MRTKLHIYSFVAVVVASVLLITGAAYAAAADECDLSRPAFVAAACPPNAVGANTQNSKWTGARIEPHSEAFAAIDAFGYCRYVGNTGDLPLFVPFSNEEEWHAYIPNHPLAVYVTQCARGGSMAVPPNFGHDAASNQCVVTPTLQNTTVPYRPATVLGDYVAPPIYYNCRSADGTPFTEVATATLTPHDSGYGPSDDIGWTFSKILYTYDGKCGAAKGTATRIAPKEHLCSVGTPSAVIGEDPFTWICAGGTGGGKNITCSTNKPCDPLPDEVKPCRCEDEKNCYRPVLHGDTCGHSWVDKTQACDKPEPTFPPQPPVDYDNDQLQRLDR